MQAMKSIHQRRGFAWRWEAVVLAVFVCCVWTGKCAAAGLSGSGRELRKPAALYEALTNLAIANPDICELVDFGDSYLRTQDPNSGFDLLAIKIARKDKPGRKPVCLVGGNIHGAETASAEIPMLFAEWLIASYGINVDATWIVDWQETWVVPTLNPDGLQANHYANARNVNLYENFDFQWTLGDGSGGLEPFSEPESRDYAGLLKRLFGDQGPLPTNGPAPVNTMGISIQVHQAGRLNLWPWTHSLDLAPNSDDFARISGKLSRLDGYYSGQLSQILRPVNGSADDWIYYNFGVPSLLQEVIDPGYGIEAPYPVVEKEFWSRSRKSLAYAAKIARAPYQLSAGPDVTSLEVKKSDSPVVIASIDHASSGTGHIVAAECYLDLPPWAEGARPIAMVPADGSFDSSNERATLSLDLGEINPNEHHMLFVRAQDLSGHWGPVTAAILDKRSNARPVITAARPGPETDPVVAWREVKFEVEAFDPDGEMLQYSWFVDGVEFLPPELGAVTFTTRFRTDGELRVTVRVNDHSEATEHTWRLMAQYPEDELILDAFVPNTTITGQWFYSEAWSPWGAGALLSTATTNRFLWKPELPRSGLYGVEAWWTYGISRSEVVPFRITDAAGIHTIHVNQRAPSLAHRWNAIGDFIFLAGPGGLIEISGENGEACADAVRFVLKSPAIARQPASLTAIQGSRAELSVVPLGEAPFQFTWFKDGAIFHKSESPALVIEVASEAAEGSYRVVVSNRYGSTQSEPCTLRVVDGKTLEVDLKMVPGLDEILVRSIDPIPSGMALVLEMSSGFDSWRPIQTNQTGVLEFRFSPPEPFIQQFFRLRLK